jgi:hypothetical protein
MEEEEEEEEIFQSLYAVYVRALIMLGTVISKAGRKSCA